jgi:catechol 2,3-dioxygenase-like lactoylglutathione lyase family enzyme
VTESRPRLVGINHVALEVDDIDETLEFYGRIFDVELRGRSAPADAVRHFGLVVDDKEAARRALEAAGVEVTSGSFLDFHDPSGNLIQIVQYDEIQFTKTDRILSGMGLDLDKSEEALVELREKGLA